MVSHLDIMCQDPVKFIYSLTGLLKGVSKKFQDCQFLHVRMAIAPDESGEPLRAPNKVFCVLCVCGGGGGGGGRSSFTEKY